MSRLDPHSAPTARPPARPGAESTAELVVTVILCVVLAMGAVMAAIFIAFFGMAGDTCGQNDSCNTGMLTATFAVGWGGVALSGFGAVILAIIKPGGSPRWVWPILGIVGVVVSYFLAAVFASQEGG